MDNNAKAGAQAIAAGYSKEELLKLLNEKSNTFNWDAAVIYNRGRANALLMQQYIQKLTAENYMQPIDGEIPSVEGSNLKFFGIQLGIPRLSFENASLQAPSATVTLPITAGLAILDSKPIGGFKAIHAIMRPNGAAGPKLWLEVELIKASGGVDDIGKVTIDLSQVTKFDTDLFSDPVSIINAQTFFLNEFKKHPELQVYTLGTLSKQVDSTLAPQAFKIFTQAAPGSKTRGAPNYGDGAVVLFVTLKGGEDGGSPSEEGDFKYMIPNDENGTKYSSAVLLSGRALFERLLPTLNQNAQLQFKLEIQTDPEGHPLYTYAQAISGDFIYPQGLLFESSYDNHNSDLRSLENTIIKVTTHDGLTGLRFMPSGNNLLINWRAYHTSKWNQKVDVDWGNDIDQDGYFEFKMTTDIELRPEVDPGTGVVRFNMDSNWSTGESIAPFEWLEFFKFDSRMDFANVIFESIRKDFFEKHLIVPFPDFDTFLLQNLLFPDLNSMVLTDAHVPGDLAVFGNVDPSLTSFVITPENPVLSAGTVHTFTTDPVIDGVKWERRALPGDTTGPIGSFSDNGDGTYTAPTADEMAGMEAQQVIVTATATLNNREVSSSALVSIVRNVISVNPLFKVLGPGDSLELTAGTLDDRPLNWALVAPGQGGDLQPMTGKESTYTASSEGTGMFILDHIQVTDDQANMGEAHILIINKTLGGQVEVDLKDAQSGKAQLQFMITYEEDPVPVPHDLLKWVLLAGTGSIDANGLYTEPEQQQPGYAIVTCAFETEPDFPGAPPRTSYGFTVLPLPLAAYPDLGRAYN